MPGYVAGASLVFLKVFDDLGTPLLLNINTMLAPQAYLRITSIGISDPDGIRHFRHPGRVFSLLALWTSFLALRGKDYATVQKGGGGLMKRDLRPWEKAGCYAHGDFHSAAGPVAASWPAAILSFGTVWSFAVLPDAFTLEHYFTGLFGRPTSSSPIRCSMPVSPLCIDVVFGTAIAYVVLANRAGGPAMAGLCGHGGGGGSGRRARHRLSCGPSTKSTCR